MYNTVNNVIEDIWESSEPLVLTESTDEVIDGSHIIGRVVGECFFPGGVSRNKRRYSESLWKKTLDKLAKSETFSRRDMLGTVGHGQPIDEAAILDGKITHIVNKLWVSEDNKGMGEFLILGTTSGRNLYTLLKAGKKISFSTRASGSYKGKDSSGNDLMNEDTYELQTVDFVIDPGFLKALPSIIESNQIDKSTTDLQTENQTKTSSQSANISIKENTMSDATKEFVDHLKNENATVKADRDKLLTQASDLNATIDQLNAKIADLQSGSAAAGEIAKELESTQSALATAQAELKSANDKLAAYSELGEPEELQEALDKSAAQVARLLAIESKLGSAEDIENALDSRETFINIY
jgi:cell division protein FtsB